MKIWAILIRCANCVLISLQQLKSINIITLHHVVWKFDISPPTPSSHFSLYVWCCVLPAFLLTFLLHSPFLRSSHEHDQLLMAFSLLLLVFSMYFHRESSLYLFYIIHQIFVHKSSCTLDVGMIFMCVYMLPIVDPSSCNWVPSREAISVLARRRLSALLHSFRVIMNFCLTLIMLNEIIRVLFINVH